MRVQILSEIPTSRVISEVNGLPNIVPCNGLAGMEAVLIGVGTVDLYTYQMKVWRKFPQGTDITDDGSFVRLVTSDNQSFACLVSQGDTDVNTEGDITMCRRG